MPATLKERLQSDLAEARRSRDKVRTVLLTTTLSEVRNREIAQGRECSDEDVVEVVAKAVKQRREAARTMAEAGRSELADKESSEAGLLEAYLPEQMTEDEVREIVRELVEEGTTDMGPLMGRLMQRIKGRFDGRDANRIVREELNA